MRPLRQSDGHDAPGLIDEAVPREAAVIDDIVVGCEDAIGEPVVAHELPDVFALRQAQEGSTRGIWVAAVAAVMLAGITNAAEACQPA